jgi:pimeloyl-ACP methyl ester carboxylesterase
MTTEVRSSTVDVRGTEVPCLVAGEGPPLLWLHGAGGSDSWSPAQDALAERFTVWAPAHPGFAGTTLPDWVRDVHDLAFHYVDFLGAAGLEHPTVVGISLGGWIATDLAVHRPDLLSRLVLVDALGLRPESPMPDLFILEPAEAMGVLFGDDGPPPMPVTDAGADPVDLIVRMYEEQAASARLMWKRPYDRQLERRLHHVTVPTLVLWGSADRLLPASHGRRLASLVPGARFEVIDGAGHVVPLEAPDAFARLVTDFALEPTGDRS